MDAYRVMHQLGLHIRPDPTWRRSGRILISIGENIGMRLVPRFGTENRNGVEFLALAPTS